MSGYTHDRRKPHSHFRLTIAQLIAYLIFISAVTYSFYVMEQTNDRLCEQSATNREAIREVYRDVAELGRVLTNTTQPESRKQQLREEIAEFEQERLDQYPPLPKVDCLP